MLAGGNSSQKLWVGVANLEEFWPFLCVWLIFTSIFRLCLCIFIPVWPTFISNLAKY